MNELNVQSLLREGKGMIHLSNKRGEKPTSHATSDMLYTYLQDVYL